MIKSLIYRIFNLYPGEARTVSLFCCLAFIWAVAAYCGVTLSDGFFLQHVSVEYLPYTFLCTSIGLFVFAFISLKTFHLFSVRTTYTLILTMAIIGYGTFFALYPFFETSPLFWGAFKVFCNLFLILLTSGFWAFLDQYFHLQHAKRLYALFNAAFFLGNMCGSLLIVVGLSPLGATGLLAIVIALLITATFWMWHVSRKMRPTLTAEESPDEEQGPRLSLVQSVKKFLTSPFALLLMTSYLLIQLMNVTCEYTYMENFGELFGNSDSNELTIFLSTCTTFVSLANVIFGCFFYSRLVWRIGINNMVLISPLFFFATFFGWNFSNSLIFAVLGIVVVEGISYLIDENTSHLLLNAVPPQLKRRTRLMIDSLFEPLGMLLGVVGFLLFDTKIFGLFLTLVSLWVVWQLRQRYRRAVLHNLMENTLSNIPVGRRLATLSKKELKGVQMTLLSMLRQDEPSHLFAIEMLLAFNDKSLLFAILRHTHTLSLKSKRIVFDLLEKSIFSAHPQTMEHLQRWRTQLPPGGLKQSIERYFVRLGKKPLPLSEGTQISFLEEQCLKIAALSQVRPTKEALLQLLPFLEHAHPKIVIQTLKSAACVLRPHTRHWILPICDLLRETNFHEIRMQCLHALDQIRGHETIDALFRSGLHLRPNERLYMESMIASWGQQAVEPLVAILTNHDHPSKVRLSAARALKNIRGKNLQFVLSKLVPELLQDAICYYRHTTSECFVEPEHSVLLKEALQAAFDERIDLVVQLQAIKAHIEESPWLSHALHSKNNKIRADALEMIEKTSDAHQMRSLRPLIDERPFAEKMNFCAQRQPLLPLKLLLERMQKCAAPSVQAICMRLHEECTLYTTLQENNNPLTDNEVLSCP